MELCGRRKRGGPQDEVKEYMQRAGVSEEDAGTVKWRQMICCFQRTVQVYDCITHRDELDVFRLCTYRSCMTGERRRGQDQRRKRRKTGSDSNTHS